MSNVLRSEWPVFDMNKEQYEELIKSSEGFFGSYEPKGLFIMYLKADNAYLAIDNFVGDYLDEELFQTSAAACLWLRGYGLEAARAEDKRQAGYTIEHEIKSLFGLLALEPYRIAEIQSEIFPGVTYWLKSNDNIHLHFRIYKDGEVVCKNYHKFDKAEKHMLQFFEGILK